MNRLFKHKLTFEFSAFSVSLLIIFIAFIIVSSNLKGDPIDKTTEVLKLDQPSPDRGLVSNYNRGLLTEMMLMSSLSRSSQLTLLGSSEFSSNENCSYIYLPANHEVPTMAFGHAFHQSFSMYCELLAGKEYLRDSKVVIFLSPGWFETEGTNTEAFLEFVPPHFLEKIWTDESISKVQKVAIGRYIYENAEEFSNLTQLMQSFKTLYESEQEIMLAPKLRTKLQQKFPRLNKGNKIKYNVQNSPSVQRATIPDYGALQKKAAMEFLKSSANNSLYVDSTYFNYHILQSDGGLKMGSIKQIPIDENAEYRDFKLLLKLLKENNVDCSFIIQGLNPYYYDNLSEMDPLIQTIIEDIENAKFPYLNMFTSDKSKYQPGVLKDVMHLGNLGWMQVNEFIFNTYCK